MYDFSADLINVYFDGTDDRSDAAAVVAGLRFDHSLHPQARPSTSSPATDR